MLPTTLLFQYLFLNNDASYRVIAACTVVCAGFFVGLFGDRGANGAGVEGAATTQSVSLVGVFFGLLSSLTTAYHAIIIKQSLDVLQGDTMELVWYNNVCSAIALLPLLMLTGELGGVADGFMSTNESFPFLTFFIGTLVTGIFGFLINVAGFLQIKGLIRRSRPSDAHLQELTKSQSYIPGYAHGLLCYSWSASDTLGCLALQ